MATDAELDAFRSIQARTARLHALMPSAAVRNTLAEIVTTCRRRVAAHVAAQETPQEPASVAVEQPVTSRTVEGVRAAVHSLSEAT